MAEGMEGSGTSDGAASRMSDKALIDFLLESDSDLSSLSEESSDEEDKNNISIDSETEEKIILEEHEDIIDNIDEETSEAPDASHQTVEKDTRKRPANTSKAGQNKRKKPTDKYDGIKWQKELPTSGMKRRLFTGVPGISATVVTERPINIFELMITDELVEIIVEQTNLYFQQNIVGKIFKKSSCIMRYLESKQAQLFNQNDIDLYFTMLLYHGVVHKPIYHMYYMNDKIFETPGFRRIISQNKLVLIEKYIHFVDISELIIIIRIRSYNHSSKIHPIHKYIVECWQSLLTLGCDVLIDEALFLWKGRLSLKQFIRTKRTHFGIKTFVLADACMGYVWNSVSYMGGDTRINPDVNFTYDATNIVMSLAEDVLDEGRRIYVDNWYSSVESLDELGKCSTDVIGTVQKDRKALPKDIVNAKLNKRETKAAYSPLYNAMCMQWKDKSDVCMLLSCIPDENVNVV